MTLRLAALLIVAILGGAMMPALADDNEGAAPGLAYASLFFPVPSGTAISVRPWDNSDENQRVKLSLAQALSRRGVPLTDGKTSLMFNFETEVDSLAVPGAGASLGHAQGRNWDSRIRMNLWSNAQDSVLNGSRAEGSNATTRYILRATLDDQQSGQRLWQGEASYTGAVTDEAATFSAMAPVLVEGFGENLRPKSFRIQ